MSAVRLKKTDTYEAFLLYDDFMSLPSVFSSDMVSIDHLQLLCFLSALTNAYVNTVRSWNLVPVKKSLKCVANGELANMY